MTDKDRNTPADNTPTSDELLEMALKENELLREQVVKRKKSEQ